MQKRLQAIGRKQVELSDKLAQSIAANRNPLANLDAAIDLPRNYPVSNLAMSMAQPLSKMAS
jgi:hypothetical protein